jgi:hypothetical protein
VADNDLKWTNGARMRVGFVEKQTGTEDIMFFAGRVRRQFHERPDHDEDN